MSGFVAISRDIIDHPLFKGEHQRLYAWQWLLCKAAWKPVPYNINGQIVTIQRGQLCASIRQLAEEWGMSKSAADRFMTRLKTETMIETEAGHGKLIITICNYGKYQDATKPKRDTSGTPNGTAAGHERDIKEPVNQITKEDTPLPPKGAGKSRAKAGPVVECPDGVSADVWRDFLTHRKRKGGSVTQTVINEFTKEANDVGWSLEEAMRESILRGWQGFKAKWIRQDDADNRRTGRATGAASNRDGFVNACLDAAMGGDDACDPFGPRAGGTGHGGAQPVLRLAAGGA